MSALVPCCAGLEWIKGSIGGALSSFSNAYFSPEYNFQCLFPRSRSAIIIP